MQDTAVAIVIDFHIRIQQGLGLLRVVGVWAKRLVESEERWAQKLALFDLSEPFKQPLGEGRGVGCSVHDESPIPAGLFDPAWRLCATRRENKGASGVTPCR